MTRNDYKVLQVANTGGSVSIVPAKLQVLQDGKRGRSLGVVGTPTVFLNGKEVPFESLAEEKLRVVINSELARGQ